MSDKPTKERILDAAEELMLKHSFHSVGLTQILKAVNVPKGSFYHHFASKEEFGVELLKHYTNQALDCKYQALLKPGLDDEPVARLLGYYESAISSFQSNGGSCPCLIVKLAAEVMDLNEEMREVIAKGFASGLEIYETVLNQAVEEGSVPKDLDIGKTAQVVQDLWYGSLQRAVASKSVKPLRNALTVIKETLQAPVPV